MSYLQASEFETLLKAQIKNYSPAALTTSGYSYSLGDKLFNGLAVDSAMDCIKYPCAYCHGNTYDDYLGNCAACGAPRITKTLFDDMPTRMVICCST